MTFKPPRAGRLWSTLVMCVCLLLVGQARAKVYIEINQPSRQPFPLAIPEFRNLGNAENGALNTRLADQITADLALTGLFNLMDRKTFLEDPKTAGILPDQFSFDSWRQIDALGLVKGGYTVRGQVMSVEFRAFDVLAGAQIGGRSYTARTSDVNRIAHQIASEIVLLYTGERGFFQSKIAAVSNVSGHKEIVVLDVTGKLISNLTNNGSINILPAWAPQGNRVSFTSYKAGNPDLYVADLVKGVTRKVSSFKGINSGAVWSPRGGELALTLAKDGDPELYLLDENGAEIQRLTRSYGVDSTPTWSPDGSKLAFVSSRAGGAHIYTMNRDGSGVKRLTYSGNQNVAPAWSPKGDRIAYASQAGGGFDIFVMDTDGGNVTRVTQTGGDNEDPSWSPDGNYLVFSSTRSGRKPQLYVASADGRSQVQITHGPGGFSNPRWSPHVEW